MPLFDYNVFIQYNHAIHCTIIMLYDRLWFINPIAWSESVLAQGRYVCLIHVYLSSEIVLAWMAGCITSMTTWCGTLHIFSYDALKVELEKIAERPQHHVGGDTHLFEGYEAEQWAKFAQVKSKIASSICSEMADSNLFCKTRWNPMMHGQVKAQSWTLVLLKATWSQDGNPVVSTKQAARVTQRWLWTIHCRCAWLFLRSTRI